MVGLGLMMATGLDLAMELVWGLACNRPDILSALEELALASGLERVEA